MVEASFSFAMEASSLIAFTPTELPQWRDPQTVNTSSMIAIIQQLNKINSKPRDESQRNATIADFVFSVADMEGEGFESLHQTQQFLNRFQDAMLEELSTITKISGCHVGGVINNNKDAETARDFKFTGIDRLDDVKEMIFVKQQANSMRARATLHMYDATKLCLDRCRLDSQPRLDTLFIKSLHEALFSNTEDWNEAGKYRKCSAFTRTASGELMTYLSSHKIVPELNKLVVQTNTLLNEILCTNSEEERTLKLLKLGGAFFMQFETIHPFHDGNGRVGRLLLAYLLASITPFQLNPFYVDKDTFPVFVDRTTYLRCFESDPKDACDITALIVEGVFVAWKNCVLGGTDTR